MNTDLRFTLQHAGDMFADAVHKTADTVLAISRTVIDSYEPTTLLRKRKKLSTRITRRASTLFQEKTFVNAVHNAADSAVLLSKKLTRAYDINSLKLRKKKISSEIVDRVSLLTKGEHGTISHDGALSRLVSRLNGVEKELSRYTKRNSRKVSPVTTVLTKLGKALFGAK